MKFTSCLLVLAAATCVFARTATRTPAVSAHITSLTDKDAKHKASVHPAFANAGRQAGVEIWRIKDFDPVPVPQNEYGKFYKGDSYIVLKTTSDKKNNLSWDIYYWIGSESTQDESGAAAILTVGLDDKFGGAAIQHRETLGSESQRFKENFQQPLQYLSGGHPTALKHVTTNAGAEKRLIQVKGKRDVRTRQVDPQISSMNKGDCFILDVGNDILVYVGEKAKNVEKLKAISVANQIRDQDHSGRGKVDIIDQYSSEVDTQKFFALLGSGSRDVVPKESAGGDDQAFEKSEKDSVTLLEVSDSSGSVKSTPLKAPFRQEQLKPQEAYILDTVSGSIYVWIGKQATDKEKTEAMSKAQQLLSAKNYPSWVKVVRIPQNTESAIFKQYFATWRDAGASHSRLVRDTQHDLMRQRLESAPRLFKVSIQEGKVLFEEVVEFSQADLVADEIVLVDTEDGIYVWNGKETMWYQRKMAPYIVQEYARIVSEPEVPVEHIKQGLEPPAFKRLFHQWDPDMWKKQRAYEAAKAKDLRMNEINNF